MEQTNLGHPNLGALQYSVTKSASALILEIGLRALIIDFNLQCIVACKANSIARVLVASDCILPCASKACAAASSSAQIHEIHLQ